LAYKFIFCLQILTGAQDWNLMDEDASSSDGKISQSKEHYKQKKHKSVAKNEASPSLTQKQEINGHGSTENFIRRILW